MACPHTARATCNYHYDQEHYSSPMSIETLVSYNICTDGVQQDCLYIEQGHFMTPTTFMTYSMAIDPRKTVVVTWTPIRMYSMQQGSQPSSPQGSPYILPLKGLSFRILCLILQNRREAGSGHARYW